jgi:hypothetical protein
MTQDEIIEMACQAFGGLIKQEERPNFIAFAKLVAAKEREACAKVAENRILAEASDIEKVAYYTACKNIAKEIRARGQA